MTPPDVVGVSPFFIVRDMARTLSFHREARGFDVEFTGFGDDLFFGIVRRGGAMMPSEVSSHGRDPWRRWP